MVRHGIKDKVAVIGCEATKYGERWDKNQYDLLAEACDGAFKDAGIVKDDVDAAWLGVYISY